MTSGSELAAGVLAPPRPGKARVRSAVRLLKERGFRGAMRFARRELYSNREFLVLQHTMEGVPDVCSPQASWCTREVAPEARTVLDEVCRAWPAEMGEQSQEQVRAMVRRRADEGAWCFVLLAEERLAGAVWLLPRDEILSEPFGLHWSRRSRSASLGFTGRAGTACYGSGPATCPVDHRPGERIVRSLFVVPGARGNGFAKVLLRDAVAVAFERGVPQVLSRVWPWRVASLKAHVSVGFRVVGSLREETRFRRSRCRFQPSAIGDSGGEDVRGRPVPG